MDAVSRRRRVQRPEEPAAPDPERDFEFQAALSQRGFPGSLSSSGLNVNASPGTLEAGVATAGGQPEPDRGPVASPFHSERVRAEVDLLRNRPSTLDADASRLNSEIDESALGDLAGNGGRQEPNYGSVLEAGTTVSGGPRVARVETADVGFEEPSATSGVPVKASVPMEGSGSRRPSRRG